MFVFALFNLQGTFAVRLAANFDILPQAFRFVKYFFQFLKISFCAPQRRSDMHYIAATRKSQAKFCQKSAKKRGPNGPRICIFLLKPCLRSGHSRHRCAYTPQQRHLHCPHPGKQRNYAPADSSAARPPHGAWA